MIEEQADVVTSYDASGGSLLPVPELPSLEECFTAREDLPHQIDVRGHLAERKRALGMHTSQAGTGRTIEWLLRLPPGIDRLVLGREWFHEVGRQPSGPPISDIFATLR